MQLLDKPNRTYVLDPSILDLPLSACLHQRWRQCCNNSGMMLVILFSLKTMETLQNGLQPPFWSVITELMQC